MIIYFNTTPFIILQQTDWDSPVPVCSHRYRQTPDSSKLQGPLQWTLNAIFSSRCSLVLPFSSIKLSPYFECAQVAWCNEAVAQNRLFFSPMKCLHLSSSPWGAQGCKIFVLCTNKSGIPSVHLCFI